MIIRALIFRAESIKSGVKELPYFNISESIKSGVKELPYFRKSDNVRIWRATY